jgi:hypothetical protein
MGAVARVRKYAIWFVLAALVLSLLSHWQTSRELSQVCDALLSSTNLTALQNDPTKEPIISAWKECSDPSANPFGFFDSGLF